MNLTTRFLEAIAQAENRSSSPLTFMWPMPGNAGGQFISFSAFADWQAFVLDLGLRRNVPDVVAMKFERAQKLLLLSWIDFDLFTAGELIAFTALDLALKDRYGAAVRRPNGSIHLADTLRYMVKSDSLTDAKIPMLQRCGGGTVVGFLTGESKPSLAERRNGLAHGDPFGPSGAGSYCAGLFELARDLIDYAYREFRSQLSYTINH
ncbi:hypothetical protein [Methylosinus sp. Ce-a6]|uniref:hypothetical protein n=1 Tax=Methylosinus sp. Ce-a6 TaxID=2172005 RepID=UPI00135C7AEC|nr:hypothetical protein [Methylosinus sp. Ce-a6]